MGLKSLLDVGVRTPVSLELRGVIRVLTLSLYVPAILNLALIGFYIRDSRMDLLTIGICMITVVSLLPIIFLRLGKVNLTKFIVVFLYPINTFLSQTVFDVDISILYTANVMVAMYVYEKALHRWLGVIWSLCLLILALAFYETKSLANVIDIDFTDYSMILEYGLVFGNFVLIISILWLIVSEMREVNKDLEKRESELSELVKNKNKFISILSHDLRGPFGSFASLVEILEEDWKELPEEELDHMLQLLKNQSVNLNKLLADLLELSSTLMGNHLMSLEEIRVEQIVSETISHYTSISEKKSVTLEMIGDKTTLITDVSYFRSILRNLLSNALKYTPEGGTVQVKWHTTDNFAEVAVIDTGIGVDPSIGESLFSYSRVVSREGTNNEKGTGLGLILCKEFIQRLGGEIWHQPGEYKGTKFIFRIPMLD